MKRMGTNSKAATQTYGCTRHVEAKLLTTHLPFVIFV
jgi:hypothetical protein